MVVLASLAVVLLATAPVASAEDIPKLVGQVTDSSGELAGHEAEIESALDQVLKDHHVQVFVLYVKTTGDLTSTEFADQTAAELARRRRCPGPGGGRRRPTRSGSGTPSCRSPTTRSTRRSRDRSSPGLRSGDFAGAAVEAAKSLGVAADSPAPKPTIQPVTAIPGDGATGDGATAGDGGLGKRHRSLPPGIVLGARGGGLLALVVGASARGGCGGPQGGGRRGHAGPARERPAHRDRRADLLCPAGGRLRRGPVRGRPRSSGLWAAVAAAQEELKAAFTVRQKLDDEIPEDDATRQAMQREIVEPTTRAQADARQGDRPDRRAPRPRA